MNCCGCCWRSATAIAVAVGKECNYRCYHWRREGVVTVVAEKRSVSAVGTKKENVVIDFGE